MKSETRGELIEEWRLEINGWKLGSRDLTVGGGPPALTLLR